MGKSQIDETGQTKVKSNPDDEEHRPKKPVKSRPRGYAWVIYTTNLRLFLEDL